MEGIAAGCLGGLVAGGGGDGILAGEQAGGTGCRPAVAVSLYAVAVTDAPDLDEQPVADLRVALALAVAEGRTAPLDETQVSDQAGAVVLVAEVRPYDVIEDVSLEGVDGPRKTGELLGASPGGAGGVDDEAGDVVKVRVCDEVGFDEGAGDVAGVGVGGAVRDGEAGKGTRCEG